MIKIRPVSDKNKFPEIEKLVETDGEPVFLTKNGYGTMVLMSIDQYSEDVVKPSPHYSFSSSGVSSAENSDGEYTGMGDLE